MRRPFIAGNWKMNLHREQAIDLASSIAKASGDYPGVDIAVCPPAVYLESVRHALGDSAVGLGAQNLYHESSGAFTGEISPEMVVDIGCQYVILGHSERRTIFGETSEAVNRKVLAALAAGLTPIVCVGELLEEREAGKTAEVISAQFHRSLAGLSAEQASQIVIAYEPVWAIGTGKVASPAQAEEVHADLRKMLESSYTTELAQSVRIQYGGSVKPDNAAELLGQANIDGALVGGAALKSDGFLAIVAAAAQ